MYTLDFETMSQVMQAHQKTGFLYADLPSGVKRIREPCRVEISIKAGAIVSCSIVGSSGRRLTGKEAVRELSRLGQLIWTFTALQEIVVQPTPPIAPEPVAYVIFPLRTMNLEQGQMQSWSRMHRGVFALADGTKNVAKIAEILSTSPELVDRALRDLQAIGVIVMKPQNGKF